MLVLCMSFGIGAPLLRAMSFMGKIPQLNYKIEELEKMMQAEPLKQSDRLARVDFPLPDSPTKAVIFPSGIVRLIPCRTSSCEWHGSGQSV